jgi:hypothetical protein
MNQETSPNILGYASTPAPKAWVFAVLAIVHLVGIQCGYHVWDVLDQPGKDPALEFGQCWIIGVLVALVVFAIYLRRAWRLTLPAVIVSFAMGATTGLAAVGLHLWRCGWY